VQTVFSDIFYRSEQLRAAKYELVKKPFAIIILTSLCACSSPGTSAPQFSSAGAASVRRATTTPPDAYIAEVCERKNDKCKAPDGLVESLDGTTVEKGINQPWSLAFDGSGNLYVGNEDESNPTGTVTEYPPGSTSPSRTFSNLPGTPRALGIDSSNNVYIIGNAKSGCCGFAGWGSVYGPTGQKLVRKLEGVGSFPGRPAFDASGNLYVPNFETFPGGVDVYPPNGSKPSRVIENGIGFPKALAFDPSGNLYVLNNTINHSSNVTVYAPGSGNVLRTISKGMKTAYTMVLDSQGDVYVANDEGGGVPNEVLVYSAGTTSLLQTITAGVKGPTGLAFDGSGNLLVTNAPRRGKNTVSVFAPGATTPSQTYPLKESPTAIVMAPSQ
jgi:sugar lactone lactonase YvrE